MFCIEKNMGGREITAITMFCNKYNIAMSSSIDPIPGQIPVGSVEFVEKLIGSQQPEYYPSWCNHILHRNISYVPIQPPAFIKPANQFKRFTGYVADVYPEDVELIYSEVVTFENEWRVYVANGHIICSWWYDGDEEVSESHPHAPEFDIDIPNDFCGTLDVGMTEHGMTLVEVHLPYAIGWYGETEDFEEYAYFLIEGWKYLSSEL